jgi:MFS family permease
VKIIDLFRRRDLRWALFITVGVQLSQHFSGINALNYYSTVIFQAAGFTKISAEYANLGLGAVYIIAAVISIYLMDRRGRRFLHLVGLGGMLVTSVILVISLVVHAPGQALHIVSLVTTLFFAAFFSIGPGKNQSYITYFSVYFYQKKERIRE